MVLSGLLCTTYVIDDYIPAASENWSQRSALRTYFELRKPKDRLASWWFYYRGETFFSKGDIWVLKEPDRKALQDYIAERKGQGGVLWFITTVSHGRRLAPQLPYEYRDDLDLVYENFHYALYRLPVP